MEKPKIMFTEESAPDNLSLQDVFLAHKSLTNAGIATTLQSALSLVRSHLGMDVAFISEFVDGERVFRYVDAENNQAAIGIGDSDPLDESYCNCIVEGHLPELMTNTAEFPVALSLDVTRALQIGAYIGVPITLSDGRIYGSFCCYSHEADDSLRQRDVATIRIFADFVAQQIEAQVDAHQNKAEIIERIITVIEQQQINLVYQPLYDIQQSKVIGFEALSRFTAEPARSPDVWFNEATEAGLGEQLEMLAIEKALIALDHLPESIYISLNVSPAYVLNGAISRVLKSIPHDRVVLEVTEHAPIPDYDEFEAVLKPLRQKGLRLAVDDVGAGYASFRHILKLKPDIIKLDISITRNIHTHTAQRALAAALIAFAGETRCSIVAEGIECSDELEELRRLQARIAQGYYIGKPMALTDAIDYLQHKVA